MRNSGVSYKNNGGIAAGVLLNGAKALFLCGASQRGLLVTYRARSARLLHLRNAAIDGRHQFITLSVYLCVGLAAQFGNTSTSSEKRANE